MAETTAVFLARILFGTALGALAIWFAVRAFNRRNPWDFRAAISRFGRPYRWVVGIHTAIVFFSVVAGWNTHSEIGPGWNIVFLGLDFPACIIASFLGLRAIGVSVWSDVVVICTLFIAGTLQWLCLTWLAIRLNQLVWGSKTEK